MLTNWTRYWKACRAKALHAKSPNAKQRHGHLKWSSSFVYELPSLHGVVDLFISFSNVMSEWENDVRNVIPNALTYYIAAAPKINSGIGFHLHLFWFVFQFISISIQVHRVLNANSLNAKFNSANFGKNPKITNLCEICTKWIFT